jgi:hypothetical protein
MFCSLSYLGLLDWWMNGLMGQRSRAVSQSSNHPKIQSSGFMFRLWRRGQGQQKTHSRFQPWVLVKVSVQQAPTASLTTTTTRMTACDTFFNIADSVYPNPLPGQDLIETLDCPRKRNSRAGQPARLSAGSPRGNSSDFASDGGCAQAQA